MNKATPRPDNSPYTLRNGNYAPFLRHTDARRITVKAAPELGSRSQARIICDLPVVQGSPLRCERGLDFLKVSFHLEWNPEMSSFLDILEFMKKQVQETELDSIPVFKERGFDWNLHRTGTTKYRYRITSGDVTLMFNRRKADGKIPNCRFEIGSLSCWSPGFYSIYDRVKTFLKCYGAKIVKERVSEVHLAADFIGIDIKTLDLDNQDKWISKSTSFNPRGEIPVCDDIQSEAETVAFSTHFMHRKFTSCTIGSRSGIVLNIYDKVTELKTPRSAHKQEIFAEIWGLNQFNETAVTRVEYRIRRPNLREFADAKNERKIDTVDDLVNSLQSLWHYLTVEWTRHTENTVNRNHNQSKAKTSEFWQKVRSVVWSGVFGLVRNHPVKHKDIGMLRKQARGILMSVCACLEVEPDDIDKIVHLCKDLIEEDLHDLFEDEQAFIKKMQTKRNESKTSLAG